MGAGWIMLKILKLDFTTERTKFRYCRLDKFSLNKSLVLIQLKLLYRTYIEDTVP